MTEHQISCETALLDGDWEQAAHEALATVVHDPENRASVLEALGWGRQPN